MPAMPLRQSLPVPVAPSRAEVLRRVSSGSLTDVMGADADAISSPAHQLQQRLLQAYMEQPIHAPREDRLPLAARSAIILGVTVSLWLIIASTVALMVAFL